MADDPTVALRVDLNEIVAAKAAYSALEEQIASVGTTATAAAAEAGAATRKITADELLVVKLKQAGYRQQAADAATAASAQRGYEAQVLAGSLNTIRLRQQYQRQLDADAAAGAAAQAARDREMTADAATAARAQIAMEREIAEATVESAGVQIAAHKAVGLSALQIREPIVLVREALRGDFSRMAGSASLLGQAFGLVTAETLPFIAGFVVLAGSVAVLTAAIVQGEQEQSRLQTALHLTGNFAGESADAISAAAQSIAHETRTSAGAAEAAFLVLVSSGHVGAEALDNMGEAAVRLSGLTGESAKKISAEWASMADDPVKLMSEMEQHYHFLTDAEYRQIEALVEQGDKTAAVTRLFGDFDDALKTQTRQMGLFEGAIHTAHVELDAFWDALKNFGKAAPVAIQAAETDAKIATINQRREAQGVMGGTPFSQFMAEFGVGNEADLMKKSAALHAQMDKDSAVAAASAMHDQTITAANELDTQLKGLKDNHQRALEEMRAYRARANAILADSTAAPESVANARFALAHTALLDAQIQKRYDAERMPGARGGSMAGAINAVSTLEAAVAGLQNEIDSVSADPLAELAAKVAKAGEAAAAARTAGKGNTFQDVAQQAAEEKELLTITLQYVEAQAKETRQNNLAAEAARAAAGAQTGQFLALEGYYRGSTQGAQAYATALQRQHDIGLEAAQAQAEVNIAQGFGVNSIDEIAAHYLASLPPALAATAAAQRNAQTLQAQAKANADATKGRIAANDALARQRELETAITSSDALLLQTNEEADAYQRGALALADYNRNLAIKAEIAKTGGQMSPADAAIIVDRQTVATARLKNEQADLTRLVNEGSAARGAEAQYTIAMAAELAKAGKSSDDLTAQDKERLSAQAQITALIQQQIIDTQKLTIAVQDSIRDAFIQTGKLDFSSFKKAIEEQLRKAIYDAFLAKPIDIVVKAAVQWEQNALNSIFGGPGGGGGGIGNIFNSLFGGGGGGGISGDINKLSQGVSGFGSAVSSIMSKVSQFAGPAAAVFAIDSALSPLIQKVGGNPTTVDTVTKIFGVIPGLILALTSGPGGANHRTAYNFLPSGAPGTLQPTSDKPTSDTIHAVQQIGQSVQQFIATIGKSGIDATGILRGLQFDQITRSRLYYAGGPSGGVQTTSNDPNDILKDIELHLLETGKYTNAQEKSVVDQLVKANASLDQIEQAITDFTQAQADFTDVKESLLKFTNPQQAAIDALQAQQVSRREALTKDIANGYFTQAQINELAKDLPQLEQKEIEAALASVATGADGAAHSLNDFITAQKNVLSFVSGLMVGSLSPLSPMDQLTAAQSAYQTQLAAAQAGGFDALSGITTTAQTFLTQAQKVYGSSSAYAAIFDQVTGSLTDLGNASLASGNSQVDAINAASAALQAAIEAGALQIVGAVNDNATTTVANTGGLTPDQLQALLNALANGTEANVAAINGGFASLSAALAASLATSNALAGGLAIAA